MNRKLLISALALVLAILIGGAGDTKAQTDVQFLNSWATDIRQNVNTRNGEVEMTSVITYCASGCQSYNATTFLGIWLKMWRYSNKTITLAQTESTVKPTLVPSYCGSDAPRRNLGVTVSVNGMYGQYIGNFYLSPSDCPRTTTTASATSPSSSSTSPDAQFLTDWAARTRKDLPFISGNVQFTNATTYCSAGCQSYSSNSYLLITARTPNLTKQNVQLFQEGAAIRPTIVGQYCNEKGAVSRNLGVLASLYDRNNASVGTLFWITPSDCANLPSTNTASSSGSTNLNSGGSTASASAVEDQYWNAVSASTNVRDFQDYLNNYPNGRYVAVARLRISQLGGSSSTSVSPSPSGNSVEDQYWNAVRNSTNAQDFQSYLNAYPNGQYAALARLKINQLGGSSSVGNQPQTTFQSGGALTVEQQYWDAVKNSTRATDFQNYLNDYPNGQFVPIARLKISQLGGSTNQSVNLSAEDQYWNSINNSQRVQDYQGYLYNYPNGIYASIARLKVSQLGGGQVQNTTSVSAVEQQYWDNVRNSQNPRDFQSYLNIYPNGQFAMIARLRINQLNASGPTMNTSAIGCAFVPSKQRGADILAKAQFGSINDMKGLQTYWMITDGADLMSKRIITDEIGKEYPQLTAATREEDADFYIIFGMVDNTGAQVSNTNGAVNQTFTGEMMVFTSTPGANCVPNIRILFRTAKTQYYSAAGVTFNRHPATNASREFVKELKKSNF